MSTRLEAINRTNEMIEAGTTFTFNHDRTTYVVDEVSTDGIACHPKGHETDPYASLTLEWHEVSFTPRLLLDRHTTV